MTAVSFSFFLRLISEPARQVVAQPWPGQSRQGGACCLKRRPRRLAGRASGPPALGLKGSGQDFLGREYWPEAFPLSGRACLENSFSSKSLEAAEGGGPCSV